VGKKALSTIVVEHAAEFAPLRGAAVNTKLGSLVREWYATLGHEPPNKEELAAEIAKMKEVLKKHQEKLAKQAAKAAKATGNGGNGAAQAPSGGAISATPVPSPAPAESSPPVEPGASGGATETPPPPQEPPAAPEEPAAPQEPPPGERLKGTGKSGKITGRVVESVSVPVTLDPSEANPQAGDTVLPLLDFLYGKMLTLIPELKSVAPNTIGLAEGTYLRFDSGDVPGLERSILSLGRVLTPIILVRTSTDYFVLDGYRRVTTVLRLQERGLLNAGYRLIAVAYRASANLEHLMKLHGSADVVSMLRFIMLEHNKQLNPLEEAGALSRILNVLHNRPAVSKITGVLQDKVRKRLALLDVAPVVRAAVVSEAISPDHAFEISREKSHDAQAAMLKRVMSGAPGREAVVADDSKLVNKRVRRRVQLKDIEDDRLLSPDRARNLLSRIATEYTHWRRSQSKPGYNQDEYWEALEMLLLKLRDLRVAGKIPNN